MEKIAWKQLTNSTWVRGMCVNSRGYYTYNLQKRSLNHIFEWAADNQIKIEYLDFGILAFENEEELLMFMLRWGT